MLEQICCKGLDKRPVLCYNFTFFNNYPEDAVNEFEKLDKVRRMLSSEQWKALLEGSFRRRNVIVLRQALNLAAAFSGAAPRADDPLYELFDSEVVKAPFSVRTTNVLHNERVAYIGELVQHTEESLLVMKNFGRRSLWDVRGVLSELGLKLDMDVGGWIRPDLRKKLF